MHDRTNIHKHRLTLRSSWPLLAITCGGCGAEEHELALREAPLGEPVCSVEPGELTCHGSKCAIERDFAIHCPGQNSVDQVQLALDDKRVWASAWVQGEGPQSFRVKANKLDFVEPLPGLGFAGQAVDGTLYRYLDGPAYLCAKNDEWVQVEVDGLPDDFDSYHGVRVRPDGAGGLHAEIRTGSHTGTYRLLTDFEGQSTAIPLGSYDPNVSGEYVGKDAWDRTFSLIHTGDWETGPQILLHFSHWDQFPVGESGELGRVATPPRPELGGDAPIATLRQTDAGLELLSIVDEMQWTATTLPNTETMSGGCPIRYNSTDGVCPPCVSETTGVERDAYQLARTSGGQLWGAYLVTDAVVEMSYEPVPFGSRWRCVGTSSSEASATLHLVELASDGAVSRSLAVPVPDAGFSPLGGSGKRELGIAAYGDRVALLFPSQHHGAVVGEVVMRLLVVNTSALE